MTSARPAPVGTHHVVIVDAGAAGLSAVANRLRRRPNLDLAIVDPNDEQRDQPAWTTLVDPGEYKPAACVR